MPRLQSLASVLLGASVASAVCPARASAAITFESGEAKRRFAAYVAFLERDPARYASALATVHQLEGSEVEFRIRFGDDLREGTDGELTTDGERVVVCVSNRARTSFECYGERACLAHELEHARQFDDGEFAFEREPATGSWHAERPSFDIGDEVRAWSAQLPLSTGEDFWRRKQGEDRPQPSLLAKFAAAKTDADRARVLCANGYGRLYRVPNCVAALPEGDFRPGQLVRPPARPNYFGRVPRPS